VSRPASSSSSNNPRDIASAVVVGGGVTGLMAARRLAQAGVAVTVVESGRRLGGQVCTTAFDGLAVDVGAEALMVASPATEALLSELRLADTSVSPRPGATWLATPRGLRRLPAGVGPAGPTRLRPVVSSRILSARGVGRAALEPLVARRRLGDGDGDVAVGDFVAHRFGHEVAERFVDPLLAIGVLDAIFCRATACSDPDAVAAVERPYYRSAAALSVVVAPAGHSLALDPSMGDTFQAIEDALTQLTPICPTAEPGMPDRQCPSGVSSRRGRRP
jgi:oxygen-dependent protoporphyrinogen oxidase